MTVAELIEALKQMPQDAQVYSRTDEGDYAKVVSPDLMLTDEDGDTIDWVFFEENADDDFDLSTFYQVVVL